MMISFKKPLVLTCASLLLWVSTMVFVMAVHQTSALAAAKTSAVEYVIQEHMLDKGAETGAVKETQVPTKRLKNSMLKEKMPSRVVLEETPVPMEQIRPTPQVEPSLEIIEDTYTLGPGDEIDIIVFGERDLSHTYKISGNDTISVPLLDKVVTRGQTVSSLARHLEDRLVEDGIMVNPSVAVQVSRYRPFYILGEVKTPGSYAFVSNMTVLNAVALAGGFTYRAERDDVKILRTDDQQDHKKNGTYLEYPVESLVLPGDVILVEERFF
jgi:polysaccharide export outer membrane protein